MIKKSVSKILVVLILIGLNWTGISAIGQTIAYFNDNENSNNNLFQATMFDFSVTNRHIENFIGMEAHMLAATAVADIRCIPVGEPEVIVGSQRRRNIAVALAKAEAWIQPVKQSHDVDKVAGHVD